MTTETTTSTAPDKSAEITTKITSPAPSPSNRRKTSVTDSTAISMSTAGAGGVIIWIFECINAGQMMTPNDTTAMLLGGFLVPIVHASREALVDWINRHKP